MSDNNYHSEFSARNDEQNIEQNIDQDIEKNAERDEIAALKRLAGIGNTSELSPIGSNISMTGTEKARLMREHNIKSGSPEWFRLWFSRPYLTGAKPIAEKLREDAPKITQDEPENVSKDKSQDKPEDKPKDSTIDTGFKPPKKTITAYKLFGTKRGKSGQIYPLFIGKHIPTPIGKWVPAENISTKGFADRPGWHAGILPMAPHLRTKDNMMAQNRVWAEVEMPADVNWQQEADKNPTRDIRDHIPDGGYYRFKTSKMQGGAWIIGGALRVVRLLSDEEVAKILNDAGYPEDAEAEQHIKPLTIDTPTDI